VLFEHPFFYVPRSAVLTDGYTCSYAHSFHNEYYQGANSWNPILP